MAFPTFTNSRRPLRQFRGSAFRVILFVGTLAGMAAFAQPVPVNAPQAQALPALPTAAEFRAAVHAHPDVIITRAAREEALAHTMEAFLAHGDGSPQFAQAEELLALRSQAWIDAVMASHAQQRNHLLDQGHSALALHDAYGNLNLFSAN